MIQPPDSIKHQLGEFGLSIHTGRLFMASKLIEGLAIALKDGKVGLCQFNRSLHMEAEALFDEVLEFSKEPPPRPPFNSCAYIVVRNLLKRAFQRTENDYMGPPEVRAHIISFSLLLRSFEHRHDLEEPEIQLIPDLVRFLEALKKAGEDEREWRRVHDIDDD